MALHVVHMRTAAGGTKAVVTVESDCGGPPFTDAHHELSSLEAKNFALAHARGQGMGSPTLFGPGARVYPVNRDGQSPDEVVAANAGQPVAAADPRLQPHRFRVDVSVVVR